MLIFPGTAQDMASIDIMKFMNYHGTFGSHAHWNPHFLAWHREYLRHWEEMMMESWESIQNDGTTPYAPAGLHQWAIALFAEQVPCCADVCPMSLVASSYFRFPGPDPTGMGVGI